MRTILLFIGVLIADSICSTAGLEIDANLRWWLPVFYTIAIVIDLSEPVDKK